jgi:hypothetical protein
MKEDGVGRHVSPMENRNMYNILIRKAEENAA